jgi:hypothetical protein
MAPSADRPAGLLVDHALRSAWRSAGGGEVLGIAGAIAGDLGAVVIVTGGPVADRVVAAATPELGAVLGVRAVEVVLASGRSLAELVRDWVYQAAQGSGRGVQVRTLVGSDQADSDDDGTGPIRVLVRAVDSSARELALRLASQQEPALPALRTLLGGRDVTVSDQESLV